jgi:hypothetical protein
MPPADLRKLRADLKSRRANATGASAEAIDALDKKLAALEGRAGGFGPGGGGGGGEPGLATLGGQMLSAMDILQDADVVPTPQLVQVAGQILADQTKLLTPWEALKKEGSARD